MSSSDALNRLNSRLLLESSRAFLEARDPSFIARNIALEIMGKCMISKAAVAVKIPMGGPSSSHIELSTGKTASSDYQLLFIRGASEHSERDLLPAEVLKQCHEQHNGLFSGPGDAAGSRSGIYHHCVRLGSSTEEIGVVILGLRSGPDELSDEASEWIEQLCNLGAIALQNGLLIQELKGVNRELDRKVVELKTLFEVAREFNSLLTRDQIGAVFKYTLMGQFLINKAFLAIKKETGFEILTSNGLPELPSSEELARLSGDLSQEKAPDFALLNKYGLDRCLAIRNETQEESMPVAVVGLGPKLNKTIYSDAELQMVESIANLSLLSIEKTHLMDEMIEKRRMMEELSIARTIQQGLIPNPIPQLDSLDTALINIPSREVGGDYVDVARTPDGNLIFAIADVSGKGIPAALLMANLQAMLHVLLPVDISLSEAVGRINNLLVQHTPADRFITFFLGKYYRDESCFRYINAGHNPGYLLRSGHNVIEELTTGGLLLGALPTLMPYETGEVFLEKGDRILLYTDGVTETFNPSKTEEFGEERLKKAFLANRERGSEALLSALLKDVESFGDSRASDDLTALAIGVVE